MFKLVESLFTNPIKLPIKPGLKLTPGHIVMTAEHEGHLVIDVCDGYRPFGMVGNRCIGGNEVSYTKMAKVYPQRMIANLSQFDRKNDIEMGNSLYCNARGILTSKKPYDGAYILAKVISPATDEKKYMQVLWL